jgi:hypothetical protein
MRPPRVIFATNLLPQTGVGGWQNANWALLDYLATNGVVVHVCWLTRTVDEIPANYPSGKGRKWTLSLTGYHGEFDTPEFRRTLYFRLRGIAARIFQRIAEEFRGRVDAVLMRASRIARSVLFQIIGTTVT